MFGKVSQMSNLSLPEKQSCTTTEASVISIYSILGSQKQQRHPHKVPGASGCEHQAQLSGLFEGAGSAVVRW